jgi:hypothetical protein
MLVGEVVLHQLVAIDQRHSTRHGPLR